MIFEAHDPLVRAVFDDLGYEEDSPDDVDEFFNVVMPGLARAHPGLMNTVDLLISGKDSPQKPHRFRVNVAGDPDWYENLSLSLGGEPVCTVHGHSIHGMSIDELRHVGPYFTICNAKHPIHSPQFAVPKMYQGRGLQFLEEWWRALIGGLKTAAVSYVKKRDLVDDFNTGQIASSLHAIVETLVDRADLYGDDTTVNFEHFAQSYLHMTLEKAREARRNLVEFLRLRFTDLLPPVLLEALRGDLFFAWVNNTRRMHQSKHLPLDVARPEYEQQFLERVIGVFFEWAFDASLSSEDIIEGVLQESDASAYTRESFAARVTGAVQHLWDAIGQKLQALSMSSMDPILHENMAIAVPPHHSYLTGGLAQDEKAVRKYLEGRGMLTARPMPKSEAMLEIRRARKQALVLVELEEKLKCRGEGRHLVCLHEKTGFKPELHYMEMTAADIGCGACGGVKRRNDGSPLMHIKGGVHLDPVTGQFGEGPRYGEYVQGNVHYFIER